MVARMFGSDCRFNPPRNDARSFVAGCISHCDQPYVGPELSKYVKGTELGIVGLALVEDLARNSTNDMVRLNAAKELLSRALPEDPKEVHHVHQKAELTDEQLMGRIEDLRKKLMGAPVVDINSRKAIEG